MSNKIKILDAGEHLAEKGDKVRFSINGFYWTVTKALPWTNTVWVESVEGKKKAKAPLNSVYSIERDLTLPREVDNTLEYKYAYEEGDED